MKRLLSKSLLAMMLLVSGTVPARNPEILTIGAWNIEHLGNPERRSQPSQDVLQRPEDLAQYLRDSGVDILALEEIGDNPNTEFDPDNPILAQTLHMLSRTRQRPWKYVLFPKKDEAPHQLTGIAWNSDRVRALDGPYRIPLNDRSAQGFSLWKRWPQAMKFQVGSEGTDFVLIPMHLKANRRDNRGDNPPRQRAQETRALVQVLGSVRRRLQDRDVLLLGDTNCSRHEEKAIRNLVGAGYRDLNALDVPTTWEGPAPYDRIFVPLGQPEFRQSQQRIHRPTSLTPKQFKIGYSDHYLVTTEMVITRDDD